MVVDHLLVSMLPPFEFSVVNRNELDAESGLEDSHQHQTKKLHPTGGTRQVGLLPLFALGKERIVAPDKLYPKEASLSYLSLSDLLSIAYLLTWTAPPH